MDAQLTVTVSTPLISQYKLQLGTTADLISQGTFIRTFQIPYP